MPDISGMFATLIDFALVVIGFGLIIFVHELGHFLAARWAGIRVLAFALGFGPAAVSYRKGLGFRRGSSEQEYTDRLRAIAAGSTTVEGNRSTHHTISPTEYRLNWLPFGGYVKMLGQEDLNPDAVSEAPDSFQRCVPWKKMIVISAGVALNILTAVLLFIIVFRVGLPTEPPIIGGVAPGLPGATAVATNAQALHIEQPGLKPGDEVMSVDGKKADQFTDITMAAAMASRKTPVEIEVLRPGVAEALHFSIMPAADSGSRLLALGIEPARSLQIENPRSTRQREEFQKQLAKLGFAEVEPGMRLVSINGNTDIKYSFDLSRMARESGGKPLELVFVGEQGKRVTISTRPDPQYELTEFELPGGALSVQPNVAGLTSLLGVESANAAAKKGLRDGDVFLRLGTVEYPSFEAGLREIRSNAGRTIEATVLREEAGSSKEVPLTLEVGRDGTVGFTASSIREGSTVLGVPVAREIVEPAKPDSGALAKTRATPASRANIRPGTRVLSVAGHEVHTFADIRTELQRAVAGAPSDGADVELTVRAPSLAGEPEAKSPVESLTLRLAPADVEALLALKWNAPPIAAAFELAQILRRSSGPLNAVMLGLSETKQMVLRVYLTFGRLFEGTLKVTHLQGPVGIAHVGTLLADRGIIWLLFFLAIVSVNLAVVNFLPLPIVDGGQFLFILYEQIFKRPVPVGVQNAVTLAGLVLIGSMFLIVTFNDISNLFRSF
ncbi:MAG: site-2 protease family protein [Phycisphaeraceae bacterium]|nr:site-2 protease family protein [Phycisphaeraceae bacterium]